jgi:Domain of unknown function (DUF5666)
MNFKISTRIMGAIVVAGLSACGGGGGSTSETGAAATSVPTSTVTPTPVLAQASTSIYQGPISGLGSVVVNGLRFSVVGAKLTDDDSQNLTSADLQIGMQVKVSGSSDQQQLSGVANSVELTRGTRGPITAINAAANELTVMGQRVVVNASTAYKGATGLADLASGDAIEVYGLRQADGSMTASLIEKKNLAVYGVRGVVLTLNQSTKSFNVGTLLVDYSAAAVTGTLVNGASVKVRSSSQPTSGRLTANSVEVANSTQSYVSNTTLKLKGVINTTAAAGQMTIDGTPADISSAIVSGGNSGALKAGDVVEARGVWDGSKFKVTQIEFDGYRESQAGYKNELYGNISTYTSLSNFVVNGVTVDASAISGLTASLLKPGSYVEVKGAMQGTTLKASKVEIKNAAGTTTGNASTPNDIITTKTSAADNNDQQIVVVSGGYYETYGAVTAYKSVADFTVNGVRVNASSALVEHPERGPLRDGSFVEMKGSQNALGVFVASKVEIK